MRRLTDTDGLTEFQRDILRTVGRVNVKASRR